MEGWGWIALVVVIAAALVATVVDGWGRGAPPRRKRFGGAGRARPGGRTRPPGRPSAPGAERPGRAGAPRAREIWWAEVPYEDGPGSKDRPCLVLAVRGGSALVVKITTRHHEERPGVIPLPPGSVGDQRGRTSFLEPDELREVPLGGFRRRVGEVAPGVWKRVRHLAR